ncbi:hypothetical protein GCM10010339_88910 [Streptomyces alanosinicus]|uniref:Uncharacterized protein n=1 Tax=Streptomyces alanosinicus TaxID=68171 RepID=A0A919D6T7_9ACTN|nr:hypothetical protein GCM10010339_88910 [Streptomyces alanosinicus]
MGLAAFSVGPTVLDEPDFGTKPLSHKDGGWCGPRNTFLVTAVRDARRLQRQSSAIGIHGTLGEGTKPAVEEHTAIYRAVRDGRPGEAAQATPARLGRTPEEYRRESRRCGFARFSASRD